MILRPRQETFVNRCVDALEKRKNTLGVAPTGAGKTVMSMAVADRLKSMGLKKGLVLQHRDELVTQNRRTYHAVAGTRASSGVVDAGGKDFTHGLTFAMVQTLIKCLDRMKPVQFLIIDEAHHGAAKTYLNIVEKARELNPELISLGVTATPARGDKRGLLAQWDNVADQITLGELIASGALVRPRTFVVDLGAGTQEALRSVKKGIGDFDMSEVAKILDQQVHNEAVVEKWKELAGNRQTVVFASTVEHCKHAMEAFHAAGVSATMVDGKMTVTERRARLAAYDRGEFQVILNVAVLTEGWDHQPTSCVILLRPSSFQSTMIQMVGRGLRRLDPEKYPNHPPKHDCIVLDFGTSLLTHGSLEQAVDLDPHKGDAPKKECDQCHGEIPNTCHECPLCGYVFPTEEDLALEGGEGDAPEEALKSFVLTEVDLLNQSPFKWEDLWGDETTMVATAFEAWAMVLHYRGNWHGIGGAQGHGLTLLGSGDRLICLASADDYMREHGDKKGAAKSKSWLFMPASVKQLEVLQLPPDTPMTRYTAAAHLTFKMNSRGIKAKLESVRS